MTARIWTEEELRKARTQGDPDGDALAKLILEVPTPKDGLEFLNGLLKKQEALTTKIEGGLEAGSWARVAADQRAVAHEVDRNEHLAVTKHFVQSYKVAEQSFLIAADGLAEGELERWRFAQQMATGVLEDIRSHIVKFVDSGGYRPEDLAELQRRSYNQLLVLADKLVRAPALYMIGDSEVCRDLSAYPHQLLAYFAPSPCPDWVDEAKLKAGARVWDVFILEALIVLYASSLPSCYLMADGIPVLYSTGKLLKKEFIYQRLYETCLMVDGVLDPDGIKVIEDMPSAEPELFAKAVNDAAPEIGFQFAPGGVPKWDGDHNDLPGWKEVQEKLDRLKREEGVELKPRRYLTGKGVAYAKRVRLLHSTMRVMSLNPDLAHPGGKHRFGVSEAYDVDEHGYPINQKDLAFTLLTFALAVPRGLERWGVPLKQEELVGFLHIWRVTGHVMGVRDDLMTDDPEDAGALYDQILQVWADPSDIGKQLTDAVCEVLEDFMPRWLKVRKSLPALLVKDLLGDQAEKVLSEKQQKAAGQLSGRLAWWLIKRCLFIFLRIKSALVHSGGLIPLLLRPVVHQAGEGLFASWRGFFDRQAFFVPSALRGGWKEEAGVGPAFKEQVHRWQNKVFGYVAGGLVASVVAAVFALVSLVASGLWVTAAATSWAGFPWLSDLLAVAVVGTVVPALGAYYLFRPGLQKVLAQRPKSASERATK